MEGDRKVTSSLPPIPLPGTPSTASGSMNAYSQARSMNGRTSGPTRRSTRGQWTPEEDEILRLAVQRFKGKNWKKIAESFKDRTDVQCLHRWQKVLNPDLIKGPWFKEEDEMIVQLVKKYGPKKWSTIAQHLPGRIGKQCRERWHNHLNPGINKEAWTQEEELVLIHAHELHGNKWAELTKYLPGRTDNSIKNHWNSSVKKKLDSYKASGLLDQFQGLTLINHQNQSFFNDRVDGEVVSECSQVIYSQTASDMSNAGIQQRDDFILSEESNQVKESNYTSLEDMTFEIPGIPCEFTCSSNYLEDNFPEVTVSDERNCAFGAISLPMNSSNYFPGPPPQQSTDYSSIVDNQETETNDVVGNIPKNEEGSSEIILTQEEGDADFQRLSEMLEMERYRDYTSFQSSYQFPETVGGNTDLQPYNYTASVLEALNCDNNNLSSTPSKLSGQNDSFNEATDLESSRLLPVNTLVSEICDDHQTTTTTTRDQEVGALCYEPPRFPFLDIPFVSCDLAQSGTDTQQDFSPLGIRKLMMSSTSNLTPLKLWDLPSSDDSPDALLKSAAKSFARTPSILKKRHRDLLSPLSPFSERRFDKKTGNDVNQGFVCTSRLTKEFSHLDVIFDDPKEHPEVIIEDTENMCPDLKGGLSEGDIQTGSLINMEKEGTPDANSNGKLYEYCASEMPRGILVERDLNNPESYSPAGIRPNTRDATSLKNSSKKTTFAEPLFDNMKKSEVSSSGQPVTTVMGDSLVNEVGAENLNFFGGTPFRRSTESPSAWKSPWYFSSLVSSCPRFEPDLTVEDMGIFMSPGERSFDAIGLMKQINEQGADAYADAREVLGSETPESILRQRCSNKLHLQGESILDDRLHMTTNVVTERRVLDFSDCGTPKKSMEKMNSVGVASPC